jgi:hypothetical protein
VRTFAQFPLTSEDFLEEKTMDFTNNLSSMRLIEDETGAVLDVAIHKGDKVRIIRKEQQEAKRKYEENTVALNTGRKFVKQFPDMSARLCRRLSPNAVWLLNMLTPYVGVNSGILRYKNGGFLKRIDILGLCGETMSEATVDRVVAELCQRGILAKCAIENRRAFIMNPYVMQNGSRANATLLALFEDTEWANG